MAAWQFSLTAPAHPRPRPRTLPRYKWCCPPSLQASGKLTKVPDSQPWAQGTTQYKQIQDMLNNFTDDSYISQPISGATPPPADINITIDIILSEGMMWYIYYIPMNICGDVELRLRQRSGLVPITNGISEGTNSVVLCDR